MIAARILVFVLGGTLVLLTLGSAVNTVVIPRADHSWISATTMRFTMGIVSLRGLVTRGDRRERLWAALPVYGMLSLPLAWVGLTVVGFAVMFWSLHGDFARALSLSGSSITTLGVIASRREELALAVIEATIGLGIVALLISFLPTMYSCFSERERAVTKFSIRGGTPPTAATFLTRAHRIDWLESNLDDYWLEWEDWFVQIEETQTAYPALNFFRSDVPERSWITTAGAVLDSAAVRIALIDLPPSPAAHLCLRTGYRALRRIADYFGVDYDDDPDPTDPISVTRAEFDEMVTQLADAGVPVIDDLDKAWRDFAGWRVNYDTVLLALCHLVRAPSAPWSSDKVPPGKHPVARRSRRDRRR